MTSDEIENVIVEALSRIAPEIDAASIRADADLREQLDLDSMDFLNFVIALHERLGVDIPESDYGRLSSLDSAVRYLAERRDRSSPTTGGR
jgi:acyl carrier protein